MIKALIIAVLLVGCLLMCYGNSPAMLKVEMASCSVVALVFGLTGFNPKIPRWMASQPVMGVMLVYLGVGALFIPLNFIASGILLGAGLRLVATTDTSEVKVTPAHTGLRQTTGDIVLRESGGIVRN